MNMDIFRIRVTKVLRPSLYAVIAETAGNGLESSGASRKTN